ncbi:PiggyBac transposable element-derived protein 4 [Dictyocoela muelleri]|nr:PiggyBac transposable element-derived protein 4 [Dictyocoela muelleri]
MKKTFEEDLNENLSNILNTDDITESDGDYLFIDKENRNRKANTGLINDGWSGKILNPIVSEFSGESHLLIDVPETEEEFFETLFNNHIIYYFLALTNKKIAEKKKKKKDEKKIEKEELENKKDEKYKYKKELYNYKINDIFSFSSSKDLNDSFSSQFIIPEELSLYDSKRLKKDLGSSNKVDRMEKVTKEDLYLYLAIMLIFGINNTVNIQHAWNRKKEYSYNKKIANLMTFERFQFINRHITCISKKDIEEIKLKKCPKIISGLEELFKSIYVPGEFISIDEGMMPFKGKMKNRVYCPMKPDKWGMKFYILAESVTGFVFNLRIVGIKSTIEETVIDLCKSITEKNRKLYMDNYYNSVSLSKNLLEKKIYTTGTLRLNRGGPRNLVNLKNQVVVMNKIVLQNENLQILIWFDRKPVVLISNCYDCNEVVSGKKKEIPKVIDEYNRYMGGVDKFDQMIKYYPLKRKTNRWTQKFSMHIFELLLHNCYVLYKKFKKGKTLNHYSFIQTIISFLIDKGSRTSNNLTENSHIETSQHLPYKVNKRNQCYNCLLSNKKISTTGIVCIKCNIYLCVTRCFYDYHILLDDDSYNSSYDDEEL